MNIYKLQYDNKEQADTDFLDKGVMQIVEAEGEQHTVYAEATQAVVDLGKIIETQGTYDPDGHVITPPVYYDGVFYDIMTTQHIDFGTHTITPTDCVHGFAGYSIDANGDNVKPE
tara:strand:+ start:1219 stop:1563 length:345 start_codon:yes stop_codon:yes gene_type:complete